MEKGDYDGGGPGGPVLKDPVEGKGSLQAEKEESERLEKTKR